MHLLTKYIAIEAHHKYIQVSKHLFPHLATGGGNSSYMQRLVKGDFRRVFHAAVGKRLVFFHVKVGTDILFF